MILRFHVLSVFCSIALSPSFSLLHIQPGKAYFLIFMFSLVKLIHIGIQFEFKILYCIRFQFPGINLIETYIFEE